MTKSNYNTNTDPLFFIAKKYFLWINFYCRTNYSFFTQLITNILLALLIMYGPKTLTECELDYNPRNSNQYLIPLSRIEWLQKNPLVFPPTAWNELYKG
jgi:hypothetical protein